MHGTWKPDSKTYEGPDEYGEHHKKLDQRKQNRMVEKGRRLSGGGGGEVRELELRRTKWNAFVEAEQSRLYNKVLEDMRNAFKEYDGSGNKPQIGVARGEKLTQGNISFEINNENINFNKKMGSGKLVALAKIFVAPHTSVVVHRIDPDYYILEVTTVKFRKHAWERQAGDLRDPMDRPEEEWAQAVQQGIEYSHHHCYGLRIHRQDLVESFAVDDKTASEEIAASHYEIPTKEKRNNKKNDNVNNDADNKKNNDNNNNKNRK